MNSKAKARLIYSTISTSERVAELGVKGALVYTWLLAHCDDQGRLAGSAKKIKALVVPLMEDITVEDVEQALNGMEDADLIKRYSDDNGRGLIQILNWWEYNLGLRVRSPSKYQPPPGWHDRVTERDDMGRFRPNKELY